jgi:hypothetical protein
MFTFLGNKEITEKNILYLHKLFYKNIDEHGIKSLLVQADYRIYCKHLAILMLLAENIL